MNLSDLNIVASATIATHKRPELAVKRQVRSRAAIDQQVIMAKPKRVRKRPPKPAAKFRKDRSITGKEYAIVCVSFPIEDLDTLDAMALRCQNSRSHFIRQAVKYFGAHIFPSGKIGTIGGNP